VRQAIYQSAYRATHTNDRDVSIADGIGRVALMAIMGQNEGVSRDFHTEFDQVIAKRNERLIKQLHQSAITMRNQSGNHTSQAYYASTWGKLGIVTRAPNIYIARVRSFGLACFMPQRDPIKTALSSNLQPHDKRAGASACAQIL
jgi:hypothetical protein